MVVSALRRGGARRARPAGLDGGRDRWRDPPGRPRRVPCGLRPEQVPGARTVIDGRGSLDPRRSATRGSAYAASAAAERAARSSPNGTERGKVRRAPAGHSFATTPRNTHTNANTSAPAGGEPAANRDSGACSRGRRPGPWAPPPGAHRGDLGRRAPPYGRDDRAINAVSRAVASPCARRCTTRRPRREHGHKMNGIPFQGTPIFLTLDKLTLIRGTHRANGCMSNNRTLGWSMGVERARERGVRGTSRPLRGSFAGWPAGRRRRWTGAWVGGGERLWCAGCGS